MCGIVGAVAQRPVAPILLEGLRRLEYRGYDSAGMAVLSDTHTIERRRVLGSLFSSSMFEGRAPPGHVLLTTFVGGLRNPEMTTLADGELSTATRVWPAARLPSSRSGTNASQPAATLMLRCPGRRRPTKENAVFRGRV